MAERVARDRLSPASASSRKGLFSIHNAVISDPCGWIAQAMMLLPYAEFPFDSVALSIAGDSQHTLPPSLYLAAFNASFACLTRQSVSSTATSSSNQGDNSNNGTSATGKRVRLSPHSALDSGSDDSFDICISSSEHVLAPIAVFGLVRGIDIARRRMFFTLPSLASGSLSAAEGTSVSPSQNPSSSVDLCEYTLVKAVYAPPVVMLYSPAFPYCGYLTGEMVGEGCNAIKVRKNIKRRAHK